MISTQQLLVNVIPQADVSKDPKGAQNNSLNLTINNDGDLKKDDTKKDDSLDPNNFTMLLGQVLSNLPEQTAANATPGTNSTQDINTQTTDQNLSADLFAATDAKQAKTNTLVSNAEQNALKSLNQNIDQNTAQSTEQNLAQNITQDIVQNSAQNVSQQYPNIAKTTEQPKQNTDTQQKVSTQPANPSVDPNQINDNPAVSWIDSQSVQSMTASAGQVNTTAKKSSNDDKSLLNTVAASTLSSAKVQPDDKAHDLTPVAAAVNTTTSSSTDHDKFKQDMMQSLQQMSAGVFGATTETAKKAEVLTQNAAQSIDANQVPLSVTANPSHHTLASQTKALEIAVPVTDPQWSNKLSDHVVWLGQNDIKSAVIKIHPEELGPLEINVKVDKDMASVNIVSHSAQVRDIVDQSIPRLRDMMAEHGLNLSDVQVNAEQRSNQFAQSGSNGNGQQHEASSMGSDGDDEVQLVSTVKKGPKRLVDYFA